MVGSCLGILLDQYKAFTDTTELIDKVYFAPLLGLELSTLGSASRDTAFSHYT